MSEAKKAAFKEINDTQEFYVDELIKALNDKNRDCFKTINFSSPTGTGKTNMMALLINKMPETYFVVTTLSKGQLNQQVSSNLHKLVKQDNFFVYGLCDYTSNTKLTADEIIGRLPKDRPIIWLRDEGHINTNKWQSILQNRCFKTVNISATNKTSAGGDIVCNFTNTMMLRTVVQNIGTPEEALDKLLKIKKQHSKVANYNPCAIMRCLDPEIEQRCIKACKSRKLKYINITTEDFDMSDLCRDDNEYDVILNKFKIVEGIDIRRAHVLYMTNEPKNPATTIQCIGRCRRNALLYRDNVDILAPSNETLLKATRKCFVYYNIQNMNIDSDENGELCSAFCDRISCQELKPNSVIRVKNGEMQNGLHIIELEGETGTYRVEIDAQTGFNVIKPEGKFYKREEVRREHAEELINIVDCSYIAAIKCSLKDIIKLPIHESIITGHFNYDTMQIETAEKPCEPYYDLSEKIVIEPEKILQEPKACDIVLSENLVRELCKLWVDNIDIRIHHGKNGALYSASYSNILIKRALNRLYLDIDDVDTYDKLSDSSLRDDEKAKLLFSIMRVPNTNMSITKGCYNQLCRLKEYNGDKLIHTRNYSIDHEIDEFLSLLSEEQMLQLRLPEKKTEAITEYMLDAFKRQMPIKKKRKSGGNFTRSSKSGKWYIAQTVYDYFVGDMNVKDTLYIRASSDWHIKVSDIKCMQTRQFKSFSQVYNDRHSAIVGTDLMKYITSDLHLWIEDRSVTSKVTKFSKFNSFIQKEYADELSKAEDKLFNGKNKFDFNTRCNSCLGYCVEYYSKYLVYGEEYLANEIVKALKESHTNNISDGIVVRACMLKYRNTMQQAFGGYVAKLIKTIGVETLIQSDYREFVQTVVKLGTSTAEFVKQRLNIPDFSNGECLNSPILTIKHIAGLADYLDEHTIIDIKTTSNITAAHVRQVLAYHYLSTKRSDLDINKVIVYEAVTGKFVEIDLSNHKYNK